MTTEIAQSKLGAFTDTLPNITQKEILGYSTESIMHAKFEGRIAGTIIEISTASAKFRFIADAHRRIRKVVVLH